MSKTGTNSGTSDGELANMGTETRKLSPHPPRQIEVATLIQATSLTPRYTGASITAACFLALRAKYELDLNGLLEDQAHLVCVDMPKSEACDDNECNHEYKGTLTGAALIYSPDRD
jgi:hypothetical protein